MNPLLLLALVLLLAGMVLRMVGMILWTLVRGLWRGSMALAMVCGRPFARRERVAMTPPVACAP